MNKLIVLMFTVLISSCAVTHEPYIKAGAGYKFYESAVLLDTGPDNSLAYKISCKIEIGMDANSILYGVRHVSQCFTGAPFNNKKEYAVNELFVEYKYIFSK